MTRTEKEKYRRKVTSNLAQIRPGDRVQIVNCAEADRFRAKVFQVLGEAFKAGKTWFIQITEMGAWDIGCLEKVSI